MIGRLLIAAGHLVHRVFGTTQPSVPASQEHTSVATHIAAGDFTCEVCGHWRHGSLIEVIHLPVAGMEEYFPGTRRNFRHCINPRCITEASFLRISLMAALDVDTTQEESTRDRH